MNTYKFNVEVYVFGDSAKEAKASMIEEFDFLFFMDNPLQAACYLDDGTLEEVHDSSPE